MRHVVPDFARRPFVFGRSADAHPLDSNRREHVVLNESLVAHARDLLDDAPQNTVAEVRVGVAHARIEIQRLAEQVADDVARSRSEEHTSELQSQSNLVCRLLLEKKKNT